MSVGKSARLFFIDGTVPPSTDNKTMHFTHGQVFACSGTEVAVILGRSANGRNEWVAQGCRISHGKQPQGVEDTVKRVTV